MNASSGRQSGAQVLKELKKLREDGKFAGQVIELCFETLKADLAEAALYDTIVVAAGDGTVSRVASLLLDTEKRIGIIPLGTGNDLAIEAGALKQVFNRSLLETISFYEKAQTKPFTLWRFCYGKNFEQSLIFCNYLSFGFDAKVVRDFDSARAKFGIISKLFGKAGTRMLYGVAALKNLGHLLLKKKELISLSNQNPLSGPLRAIFFSNISSVMGLGRSNKSSSPFDDKLELNVIKDFRNYAAMIFGNTFFCSASESYSASYWELSKMPENAYIQLDGEAWQQLGSSSYRIERAGIVNLCIS